MISNGSPYRPIVSAMRSDLLIVDQVHRGEKTYVVGDAIGLGYFHLSEQEYFLLQAFDGRRSFDEIKKLFEASFSPYQIRHSEIQHYLLDFHRKSLLENPGRDHGRHLQAQGRKKAVQKRLSGLKNLLAIRFRGINPDALFRWITPFTAWFFSRPIVIVNVLFMLAAALWLGTHFDEFSARLPTMESFFVGSNLVPLVLTMILMKILHEFGHGIVFTKYGGRCHELGVMLLVFLPTLYVNTSDAWRIRSKYKRAAVAAAGVYVELWLAAVATFCWWFAKTSLVENLSLNVMLLGSVSALVFNGNPLLKFDGYFCLSDLIEIPNLRQRSGQFVRNKALHYGLGVREGDDYWLPWQTKAWLASYLIASFLYRIFILYCIAFIVVSYLSPVGLASFGKLFSAFLMVSLALFPTLALVSYFRVPGRIEKVKKKQAIFSAAVALVGLILFVALPLPDRVLSEFVVEPTTSERVYVRHQAKLEEIHVHPQQWVNRGTPIATLRNVEVELELAELEGQLAELVARQKLAKLSTLRAPESAEEVRIAREEVVTIQNRIKELSKILDSMVLTAPRDGHVIVEWREAATKDDPDVLDSWDGSALDPKNLHATFGRGESLCAIGDLSKPQARLIIDQADIESVQVGQKVQLLLDARSLESVDSRIEAISINSSERVLRQVAQNYGGSIETKKTRSAQLEDLQDSKNTVPADAVFEAVVSLPSGKSPLEIGLRGSARIDAGHKTLAAKCYRFLHRTFRFDL